MKYSTSSTLSLQKYTVWSETTNHRQEEGLITANHAHVPTSHTVLLTLYYATSSSR